MPRHDYAFPFRIDGSSRQAQQAPYEAHVRQMIRQVLLTAPGERVNLPDVGCGLRRLLCAPYGEALEASVKITVLNALNKWLADQIRVKEVRVSGGADAGELRVDIEYVLIETQRGERLQVMVS